MTSGNKVELEAITGASQHIDLKDGRLNLRTMQENKKIYNVNTAIPDHYRIKIPFVHILRYSILHH